MYGLLAAYGMFLVRICLFAFVLLLFRKFRLVFLSVVLLFHNCSLIEAYIVFASRYSGCLVSCTHLCFLSFGRDEFCNAVLCLCIACFILVLITSVHEIIKR